MMSRSGLYLVIAVLIVVVAGFGIYTYQQQTKPGVEIKMDSNGLQVHSN